MSAAMQALALVPAKRAEIEESARRLVAEARAEGANWGQIGAALGTTRQAARERYGTATNAR